MFRVQAFRLGGFGFEDPGSCRSSFDLQVSQTQMDPSPNSKHFPPPGPRGGGGGEVRGSRCLSWNKHKLNLPDIAFEHAARKRSRPGHYYSREYLGVRSRWAPTDVHTQCFRRLLFVGLALLPARDHAVLQAVHVRTASPAVTFVRFGNVPLFRCGQPGRQNLMGWFLTDLHPLTALLLRYTTLRLPSLLSCSSRANPQTRLGRDGFGPSRILVISGTFTKA